MSAREVIVPLKRHCAKLFLLSVDYILPGQTLPFVRTFSQLMITLARHGSKYSDFSLRRRSQKFYLTPVSVSRPDSGFAAESWSLAAAPPLMKSPWWYN